MCICVHLLWSIDGVCSALGRAEYIAHQHHIRYRTGTAGNRGAHAGDGGDALLLTVALQAVIGVGSSKINDDRPGFRYHRNPVTPPSTTGFEPSKMSSPDFYGDARDDPLASSADKGELRVPSQF